MTSFLVRIIFVALCVTSRVVFSLENRNNNGIFNDQDFKVLVQAQDQEHNEIYSVQTASGFDDFEKTSKVMNLTLPDRVYAGACAANSSAGGTGGGILQSLSFYNCYYIENCTLGLDRNYTANMIFRPDKDETRMYMNVTANALLPPPLNENYTITSAQLGDSTFYSTMFYSFTFNVQFPTPNFVGKNGTYGLQIEFYNPSSDPALVICRTFNVQLNTGQIHGSKLGDECFKEGLPCYFKNSVCTGNATYQTCECNSKSFLDGKDCKTQAGQACTDDTECIENAACTKLTSGGSSKACSCKNGYSSPDNDVNYCNSCNAAVLSVLLLVALQFALFLQNK